jgi:hypothetical protein
MARKSHPAEVHATEEVACGRARETNRAARRVERVPVSEALKEQLDTFVQVRLKRLPIRQVLGIDAHGDDACSSEGVE